MTGSVTNQSPFLRTSRNFPQESQPLSVEINRSYVDIAEKMNTRTIGIFPTGRPAITGESWFFNNNQRQQTLRQIYTFTAAGNIAHGINLSMIAGFTRIFGTVKDTNGTWYPLPYVDTTAANNQISLAVTSTNIVLTQGGGAPFTIASGFIVLEWLSQP